MAGKSKAQSPQTSQLKNEMKNLTIFIPFVFLLSCNQTQKVDFILSKKDFIPEGTAFNSEKEHLYIGSIYKQKIIGLDREGNEFDVIASTHFGELSPLGIEYNNRSGKLWVCAALAPLVNKGIPDKWITTIMVFDPEKSAHIKSYQRLGGENPIFLNDLTVTDDRVVFITESLNNRIFWINPKSDSLEVFYQIENFNFPNGITSQGDNLFIATDQGIVKLNMQSKTTILLEASEGVDATVIDGLEIAEDYFIGHQSSKVCRFYFNKEITQLTGSEVLDSGAEFDSSTTGKINGDDYYFIVNSQIRSGVNQATKTIKPMDSLEEIIIRKIKL